MMSSSLVLFVIYLCFASVTSSDSTCDVRLRIESGVICGLERLAEGGFRYASFRGIPYAKQPLGELRFKELQPIKPWTHDLDATEEGPVCPQDDKLYGNLAKSDRVMSEACILANVHVPLSALNQTEGSKGLPIFVFIHGGAFQAGSGDSDMYGPEYLVNKDIIVATFNYRLNVFGFMSMNSPKMPGNMGLRDQVTFLQWIKRNAKAFGGNPEDVTLGGHSAGAASAHLLSVANVPEGLFQRVIAMSGTAVPSFYTVSQNYATSATNRLLALLGINSTDVDVIHDKLVSLPLEEIMRAHSIYQDEAGLVSFGPIKERKIPGISSILDEDPIKLMKLGRGNQYPLIIGFTNAECQSFKPRFDSLDIMARINENHLALLPVRIPYDTVPEVALDLAQKVLDHYFDGEITLERYMDVCREGMFEYSAFKIAKIRADTNAAATYIYQFAYDSEFNVVQAGLNLSYNGSAHVEDLTFIFRENNVLGCLSSDARDTDGPMRDWMTQSVVNFIRCNDPSCRRGWQPTDAPLGNYQDMNQPAVYSNTAPTQVQLDMIKLYDEIDEIASANSL